MPGLTLYDVAVPTMIRSLTNLSAILTKAATQASTKNTEPSTLITARLIEDMKPLPNQIQSASDSAKGLAVRLCGHPPVPLADNESTFEELQTRISKTLEILRAVKPDSTDGKEEQMIEIKAGSRTWELSGKDYVMEFALPNFFFHVVTAYAILRSQGIDVGKMDYLGIPRSGISRVDSARIDAVCDVVERWAGASDYGKRMPRPNQFVECAGASVMEKQSASG